MSWVLVAGLALAAFAVTAALRLPRAAWTSVLAALVFGMAGYAWQARPDLPAAPGKVSAAPAGTGEVMVELRRMVVPEKFHSRSAQLIIADALARRDRPAEAATMLLGAVRDAPRDGEAWLALGNALVAAADGQMTPAARFAYREAERLHPESPGVPFFVGIAELQAQEIVTARSLWAEALARTADGSDERAAIAPRLAGLDEFLRRIAATPRGADAGS